MEKRSIIGLIGNKSKSDILDFLVKKGYYRVSIVAKIKELAKCLFKDDKNIEKDIDTIRKRGYQISKLYWINLVLATVPNDKKLIVVEDVEENDIIENIMSIYVSGENIQEKLPNIF